MQVEDLIVTLSLTGNTAERGQKIGGARGPGNLLGGCVSLKRQEDFTHDNSVRLAQTRPERGQRQ